MELKIDLAPKDWWRLQTAAESRGVPVAALIRGAVRDAVATETPVTFEERVEDMVDRGFPDAVIATKLAATVELVSRTRRRLGLRANKLRRERWAHELTNQTPAQSGVSFSHEAVA